MAPAFGQRVGAVTARQAAIAGTAPAGRAATAARSSPRSAGRARCGHRRSRRPALSRNLRQPQRRCGSALPPALGRVHCEHSSALDGSAWRDGRRGREPLRTGGEGRATASRTRRQRVGRASRCAGLARPASKPTRLCRRVRDAGLGRCSETLKGTGHHADPSPRSTPACHRAGAVPPLRRRVADRSRLGHRVSALFRTRGPALLPARRRQRACLHRPRRAGDAGMLGPCTALTWDGRHSKPLPLACTALPGMAASLSAAQPVQGRLL